ncbi:hypothetical protein FB451DRAFT_1551308 [Mycena latifolia]|nr:hypothetical protein FB451DRAFT_1551308 [Mycena latifolia]
MATAARATRAPPTWQAGDSHFSEDGEAEDGGAHANWRSPRVEGEVQLSLPADRDATPRDTPRARKRYQHVNPPDITPLNYAGPSLETSSSNIYNPGSDDDTSDDEKTSRPTRPLPARPHRDASLTPAPSTSAQSPPPQSDVDADDDMSDDDAMNDNALDGALPPRPLRLAHRRPRCRSYSPPPVRSPPESLRRGAGTHLLFAAGRPAPPIDPELNRAMVQRNGGQFRAHVITNKRVYHGIVPTQVEASPYHKIALIIANGGDHVLSRVQYEVPLDVQIEKVLRAFSPVGRIAVRLPIPDPATLTSGKYGGAATILVEVQDNAGAAAITSQVVFGVHEVLGFWAHDVVANRNTAVWAFAHWDMVRPGGDRAEIESAARAAFRLIDQLTQALGGDARLCVLAALDTAHFELLQHDTKLVVVGYMEPLTPNEAEQEQLNEILGGLDFQTGNYAFTRRSKYDHKPECAYCKVANHPAFHCPYTKPELLFWGPPGQLSDLPQSHPWYVEGNSGGGHNNDQGGRGRGRGAGYGSGGRGWGGRRAPYGRGGGNGSYGGYGGGGRGGGRVHRGGRGRGGYY